MPDDNAPKSTGIPPKITQKLFQTVAAPPKPTSGIAIASLVLGLLGLLASGIANASVVLGVFGLVALSLAIGAVICGHIGRSQVRASKGYLAGGGFAMFGLVSGYFLCVVGLLGVLAISIIRTRLEHNRAEGSRQNLRQLATATLNYTNAHDDELPPSLQSLVLDQRLPASVLISPFSRNITEPSYEIVLTGNLHNSANRDRDPTHTIFIRETTDAPYQGVLFLDGHVEILRRK